MSSLEPSFAREHEPDDENIQRCKKRCKLDNATDTASVDSVIASHPCGREENLHVLPPSHSLLRIPTAVTQEGAPVNFLETDVGISEYVGIENPRIEGIIKQRFTDFLVNEIDLDGNVVHLTSLTKPESPTISAEDEEPKSANDFSAQISTGDSEGVVESKADFLETDSIEKCSSEISWPENYDFRLAPFLSKQVISELKELYLEGPEPPRSKDNGWGSRVLRSEEAAEDLSRSVQNDSGSKAREQGVTRGSRSGPRKHGRESKLKDDARQVLSDPIPSKETRTALHRTVRELFEGKLETETEDAGVPAPDQGSRVIFKWARRGRGGRAKGGTSGRRVSPIRETYLPYIHFTLQKTNRDNQDALGYLARTLHINVKDLSVAGTKDKRGVTVQRVSLRRNGKGIQNVWNLLHGRHGSHEAVSQRGQRGIRIADLAYRKTSLELGMLKGNAFVITLRNVKMDSFESLAIALDNIKKKGFINYYGMQRFGTASVPTHVIGLALLQSDWHRAISLILQKRPGEHPDVNAARHAWLVDGNLDKALELMPRRVVAERCILESYKKQGGDTRNAMGALSTIPRNLRLMYVHAYQSYVWNAIVSERIRTFGADKPVVGDLVLEGVSRDYKTVTNEVLHDNDPRDTEYLKEGKENPDTRKKTRKPYVPPRIKVLAEEDMDKYTIFDVVMPLPGTDVSYPGGALGEKYREFLRVDGLDPDNFARKQKEYVLNGSYRSILHLPKDLSWSVLKYTDPDVPLAQADEDKLLGFDPPAVVEDGKFTALQLRISLGSAAYATMALREVTKTETSSQFQTNLTIAAEDQKYRGSETAMVKGKGEDGFAET